jgi:HD-like signal output (HDOD) protein
MHNLDDLVAGVNDLVPLPQAYVRIRELVHHPDSSLYEITRVITNDAGLTGRILRIANSAHMGLITKVDTLSRAVQVLGLDQVHDLALATTAIEALAKIEIKAFDLYGFWRRSIYCAVVARLLGKRCAIVKQDRLFVAGLLHEVGHLVLAHKEPALYADMRATAIERRIPLYQVERDVLGFDYAAVSAALLNNWQLPEEIIDPIKRHNSDLSKADPQGLPEAAVIHIAAALSRGTQWRSDKDIPAPKFDPTAVIVTDLDDELVFEIMGEADVAIIEAVTLLIPKSVKPTRRPPPELATSALVQYAG